MISKQSYVSSPRRSWRGFVGAQANVAKQPRVVLFVRSAKHLNQ